MDRNAPPPPRKQIRRNRAQIAQILEEFRQSGLTQREFAASKDFAVSSLVFWLRQERLRAHTKAPTQEPSAPVPAWVQAVPVPEHEPLPRPATSTQSKPFHLRLPSGLRLRIPADFDAATLRRLLKALEATAR